MTINENSAHSNYIDHDAYIKEAIDSIFNQPEETFEMLQDLLMGTDHVTNDENVVNEKIKNLNINENSKSESTDDNSDVEELILEDDETDSFSTLTDMPDISLLKVDNFISNSNEAIEHRESEISHEDKKNDEVLLKENLSLEESPSSKCISPTVIILNSINAGDPLPGEAVDCHVIDGTDELENKENKDLPVLTSSFYTEMKTTERDCDSEISGNDPVIPFQLDETHNYDEYNHTPKFGQEIRNYLSHQSKTN